MGTPAIDLNQVPDPLREWIEDAARMGEVLLTRGGQAVAKIVPLGQTRQPRRPGSARGLIHMAEDFGAAPEDFREYL